MRKSIDPKCIEKLAELLYLNHDAFFEFIKGWTEFCEMYEKYGKDPGKIRDVNPYCRGWNEASETYKEEIITETAHITH